MEVYKTGWKQRRRRGRRLGSLLGWLLAALGGWDSRGETLELNPVADTTLLESAPDFNMGGEWHLASGTTGSMAQFTKNRGLLRFDLAAIPPQSVIRRASLRLEVTTIPGPDGGGSPASSTFALHRVLKSWGEGNKLGFRGEFAVAGEATWNHRIAPDAKGAGGAAWSKPGAQAPADFVAAASASQMISGLGKYVFGPSELLRSDLQGWLDQPAQNFGWILISQSESRAKTARRFGSREDTNALPVLSIEFDPPARLAIDRIERDGNRIRFEFQAEQGKTYEAQFATRLAPEDWQLLKRIGPMASAERMVITDTAQEKARFYRILAR